MSLYNDFVERSSEQIDKLMIANATNKLPSLPSEDFFKTNEIEVLTNSDGCQLYQVSLGDLEKIEEFIKNNCHGVYRMRPMLFTQNSVNATYALNAKFKQSFLDKTQY